MPGPEPARILVADDEPTILELLKTVLSLWGHEVEVCSDGEAALARALEGRFALLLIDQQMPRLTGVEVLRQLRAANHLLPALLMSGHFHEEIVRECKAMSGVALLPKPFTLAALQEALARSMAG